MLLLVLVVVILLVVVQLKLVIKLLMVERLHKRPCWRNNGINPTPATAFKPPQHSYYPHHNTPWLFLRRGVIYRTLLKQDRKHNRCRLDSQDKENSTAVSCARHNTQQSNEYQDNMSILFYGNVQYKECLA